MRFVFAVVALVWLCSAVFSRKRLAAIKAKDGWIGVAIASTSLLFFLSMIVLIGTVIYAGEMYSYKPLDVASVFFFSVMGLLFLEFVFGMAFKKRKDESKH